MVGGDIGASFLTGTWLVSGAKKVVTNVYSAVALSIRTRSADRRSDSNGAFCQRARIIRARNEDLARRKSHVVLIVAHVGQSDPRSINSSVLQPRQVEWRYCLGTHETLSFLDRPCLERVRIMIRPRNAGYSSELTFIQDKLRVYRLNPVS